MTSTKYSLNAEDGLKIAKVFGWLLASTTVSFLITLLPQLDAGSMAWLLPVVNIVLVSAQKYIKDNQ